MRFNEEMDKYAFLMESNRLFSYDDESSAQEYTERINEIIHSIIEEQLTEKQRFCLKMYYFERYNSPQIAMMLGTSKSNVTKHIRKALERIKISMKYTVFFPQRK